MAVVGVAVKTDAAPDVEPVPTRWDFERCFATESDCSVGSVDYALDRIGWQSGQTTRPLLCVHPASYGYALNVARAFNGAIEVWATRQIAEANGLCGPWNDVDAWFIAWRGRRMGSIGA